MSYPSYCYFCKKTVTATAIPKERADRFRQLEQFAGLLSAASVKYVFPTLIKSPVRFQTSLIIKLNSFAPFAYRALRPQRNL